MKNFWSSFWAALLAFVLGSVIVQCIAFFVFMGIIAFSLSSVFGNQDMFPLKRESVLKLEISTLPEKNQQVDFSFYKENSSSSTLTDVLIAIDRAKESDRIKGIYLHCPYPILGMASLYELRNALEDFKNSGKWIVSYADQYSQGGYYLSSVADQLYVNPQGMIELKGLATESLFYRHTLEKLGIEMTVLKVGTYKGAVEPYLLDGFSEANKEQIRSYMNGLWSEIRTKVSESRHINADSLDRLVNEAPVLFDPARYTELALADGLLYEREVMDNLRNKLKIDSDDEISFVSPNEVLRAIKPNPPIDGKGETVVVCYAEGVINQSEVSSPFAEVGITEALANELIELADDDHVDAVVLRVNSPGGSAYVSDQIWDAVKYTRSIKPIVVSMGDYAASGGYYISCAANYIFAEPVTITGSIGIYGMIPNFAGLANKIALKEDVVKTHQYADALSSPFRPMTEGERNLMQAYIERGYDTFISRVAEGRELSKTAVDSVGQGRVWTGEQALQRKLVDELGGLTEAVKKAAKLANLGTGFLVKYKTKETVKLDNLLDLFFNQYAEKIVLRFFTKEEIEALKLSREIRSLQGVQALLPYEIEL